MSKFTRIICLFAVAALLMGSSGGGCGGNRPVKGKVVDKFTSALMGRTYYHVAVVTDSGTRQEIQVNENVYWDVPMGGNCQISENRFECGE